MNQDGSPQNGKVGQSDMEINNVADIVARLVPRCLDMDSIAALESLSDRIRRRFARRSLRLRHLCAVQFRRHHGYTPISRRHDTNFRTEGHHPRPISLPISTDPTWTLSQTNRRKKLECQALSRLFNATLEEARDIASGLARLAIIISASRMSLATLPIEPRPLAATIRPSLAS